MAIRLKREMKTLDGLTEAVKALYEANATGDGFTLKGEIELADAEDVQGLKTKNTELIGRERTALDRLKEFEGIDPVVARQLAEAEQSRQTKRLTDKGEWDTLKASLVQTHETEKKAWQAQLDEMRGVVEKHLIDAEAIKAIDGAGGNTSLLLPHVKAAMKIGDGYTVHILGTDGKPRLNAAGEPIPIKQLVSEMKAKPEYAGAFPGIQADGTGAIQGDLSGGAVRVDPTNSAAMGASLEAIASGKAIVSSAS